MTASLTRPHNQQRVAPSRWRAAWVMLIAGSSLMILFGGSAAGAASANISNSYRAARDIPTGSIVSLDPGRTNYVKAADTSNGGRLLGIAVTGADSLLAVNDTGGRAGTVQVATSGTASALVSTLGGPIRAGDEIGVSPFSGVGLKAQPDSPIIGVAQTALSDHSEAVTTQTVTDKDGRTSQIHLGYVRLGILVRSHAAGSDDTQLGSLQRLAKSLTGHTVSTTRVLLSAGVGLAALIALITLIYAAIYGSIISVGRNPLAKYAVFRTLGSVLAMAVLVAGIAGLTIFLLLR